MTPDLLERGSGWLDEQRVRHLSRPVTYWRGGSSAQVQAAVGKTVFEVDNGEGVLESFESRDFLIRAADLVLGGEKVLPESGDRISEEQDGPSPAEAGATAREGGMAYVYEVMAPGREQPYQLDRYRRTLRVHTKLVETKEAT